MLLNVFYIYSDLIARFMREETYLFVLRVMVGLVILYDHVHPVGAFQKSSNVDVSIIDKLPSLLLEFLYLLFIDFCFQG